MAPAGARPAGVYLSAPAAAFTIEAMDRAGDRGAEAAAREFVEKWSRA